MSALQWVSVGFAGTILLFLMALILRDRPLRHDQFVVLRFICAVAAGFAAALFTGETFFKAEGSVPSLKFTAQGTAGFGLFLAVWFTFKYKVKAEDAVAISIPAGWTFQQTVDVLAKRDQSTVRYEGFTPEQLRAALPATELKTKTIEKAIERLADLKAEVPLPAYRVERADGQYLLRASATPASV